MSVTAKFGIFMIIAASALAGCSTNKDEMLPPGNSNMLELWKGTDGESGATRGSEARSTLRRGLSDIWSISLPCSAGLLTTGSGTFSSRPDFLPYR